MLCRSVSIACSYYLDTPRCPPTITILGYPGIKCSPRYFEISGVVALQLDTALKVSGFSYVNGPWKLSEPTTRTNSYLDGLRMGPPQAVIVLHFRILDSAIQPLMIVRIDTNPFSKLTSRFTSTRMGETWSAERGARSSAESSKNLARHEVWIKTVPFVSNWSRVASRESRTDRHRL